MFSTISRRARAKQSDWIEYTVTANNKNNINIKYGTLPTTIKLLIIIKCILITQLMLTFEC
jgi:hypothetical protein